MMERRRCKPIKTSVKTTNVDSPTMTLYHRLRFLRRFVGCYMSCRACSFWIDHIYRHHVYSSLGPEFLIHSMLLPEGVYMREITVVNKIGISRSLSFSPIIFEGPILFNKSISFNMTKIKIPSTNNSPTVLHCSGLIYDTSIY